ncbi:copper chaperone PCu(A)C [Streptomyces iranensis]|uniref:Copper(I)-binding protein n=1 Tax=Streptomyces iranensis TaxID=576784 RepID=A0A060ZYD2_9ACTN|nr:copper chaperone PCu(A)C [Streptomyces iranensis]MBP2066678.1 copper(I)-binding protein [Streptomyces iranensis]CDR08498.1 copper(I)-binding protein [Streptomyces iranensis]
MATGPGVRKAAAVVLTAGLSAALAACGSQDSGGDSGGHAGHKGAPKLSVSGAYVSQPPMDDMAAGYLAVRNAGGGADELTSVTTPLASEVTLHTTKGNRMKQVSSLDVPADGRLELTSGGDHLMLTNLTHRPKVGERVSFTLHFATSDPIEIKVPVEPTTYRPKD